MLLIFHSRGNTLLSFPSQREILANVSAFLKQPTPLAPRGSQGGWYELLSCCPCSMLCGRCTEIPAPYKFLSLRHPCPPAVVPLLTALVELHLRPPALPGPAAALSGAFLEASLRIGPISQVHPQGPVDSNVSQGWTQGTGPLSVTRVQTPHLLLSWRRRWMIDVDAELPRRPPVPLHRPPCLQPPALGGLPEG